MTLNALLAEIHSHQPRRGINQYHDVQLLMRLHGHLLARHQAPLLVGESPATSLQAIAFTDGTRSARAVEEAAPVGWARWNAWPLHLGNVKPDRDELRVGSLWLRRLVDVLEPAKVLAVGRVAETTLLAADVDCKYVPHPGQDKLVQFRARMKEEVKTPW